MCDFLWIFNSIRFGPTAPLVLPPSKTVMKKQSWKTFFIFIFIYIFRGEGVAKTEAWVRFEPVIIPLKKIPGTVGFGVSSHFETSAPTKWHWTLHFQKYVLHGPVLVPNPKFPCNLLWRQTFSCFECTEWPPNHIKCYKAKLTYSLCVLLVSPVHKFNRFHSAASPFQVSSLGHLCGVSVWYARRGCLGGLFGSSAHAHLLLPVRPLSRHTLSKRRERHAPRVRLLQES